MLPETKKNTVSRNYLLKIITDDLGITMLVTLNTYTEIPKILEFKN